MTTLNICTKLIKHLRDWRMKYLSIILVILSLLVPISSEAKGSHSRSHRSGTSYSSSHSSSHSSRSSYSSYHSSGTSHRSSHSSRSTCYACEHRSYHAKSEFKRSHPCPSTGKTSGACHGYVIDHIRALKHGGADDPSNMQWQTVEAAKAKDKWE